MPSNGTARYSDQELEEFKVLIDKKLGHAKEQVESLQAQILEIAENSGDEHGGDWVDDSNTNTEVEMLNTMAIRQRKFIADLENALLRIKNKTYGICVLTGDLIDKRRLLAVPTTTKSLTAKTEQNEQEGKQKTTRLNQNPYTKKKVAEKKVISKVIKKSGGTVAPAVPKIVNDDDDDDDDDYGFDDDMDDDLSKTISTEDLDLDEIADDNDPSEGIDDDDLDD